MSTSAKPRVRVRVQSLEYEHEYKSLSTYLTLKFAEYEYNATLKSTENCIRVRTQVRTRVLQV